MSYNLEFDYIEVKYTDDEINEILKRYDEKTQEIMESLAVYINNPGLERYHDLTWKEAKRSTRRKYIKTSDTTFSNTWLTTQKKEDKTAHITVNPQYIKK